MLRRWAGHGGPHDVAVEGVGGFLVELDGLAAALRESPATKLAPGSARNTPSLRERRFARLVGLESAGTALLLHPMHRRRITGL